MKTDVNEVEINGIQYVKKGDSTEKAVSLNGMEYLLVRTESAGVFAGYSKGVCDNSFIVLYRARRIWYWAGAASLSQLAIDGTAKPDECKFPEAVEKVKLFEVIEILYPTAKAQKSIEGVPIWKN